MMVPAWMSDSEAEWRTRKSRIDPRLDARGWTRARGTALGAGCCRSEEYETANGPADYALCRDGNVLGIVEAKKLSVGPQGVLTQAERYARGIADSPYNFDGVRVPFLYSTNGEVIWFHDARHPLNRSRQVADFHTPSAFEEMLGRDFDGPMEQLRATPHTDPKLRPYQRDAIAGMEQAIADRKRRMMVAMATGTGKTRTLVNQVFRLMQARVARRILFLVDRRALAAQTVRAFSSFEALPGQKFDQLYEVYSQRFQSSDFDENEKFDPKLMPESYLVDPKPGFSFVYICTIQRMASYVLGPQALQGLDPEMLDDTVTKLDIPIHAFDVVIADECHRGYSAAEQSVWRSTLDHFDSVTIGLTATPAAHTMAYFRNKVFSYGYEEAVRDGFLVDYRAVHIRSDVRMNGIFLKEGEEVERVDPDRGTKQLDLLEDERHFETTEIEAKITAPDSNRKIIEKVKEEAEKHEAEFGRFPKTLIFAVNDMPHMSHADQLVDTCRDVFGRGESFVQKITGRVDRPLQRIREFRNRPQPGIAVTVDLLSTGVDIPDLEFIVFLRPVKSRILFEQMLGRGTRKGEHHPDKPYFTVFDCFDGTLLEYFRKATGITAEAPDKPTRKIEEIIADIWSNRDREYNVNCLVKRLHRVDRQMAGEARDMFAAFVPDGDVARYARGLAAALREDFTGGMKLLRDGQFQSLLVSYPRPPRTFYVASGVEDTVSSRFVLRDADGTEYKPEDYLAAFERFVRDNPAQIEAIAILLDRPRDWGADALEELRRKLVLGQPRFSEKDLRRAHEMRYHRSLVDIISMVKHAADEHQPLLTAAERVATAFDRLTAGQTFTGDQQKWLDRIRAHLIENLSIDADDFDIVPIFSREGGLAAARRVFGTRFDAILHDLNGAIAA
jgi:type I restriction enzyme, R subunit